MPLQGWFLVHEMSSQGGWQPHHCIGFFLWVFGWLANLHADHALRSLRRPGETGAPGLRSQMHAWMHASYLVNLCVRASWRRVHL